MKKLSRKWMSRASVMLSGMAVVFYLVMGRPEPTIPVANNVRTTYKHYQIVLLDDDAMLIPITVQVDAMLSMKDQWNALLEHMKTTQTLSKQLRGFLDSDLAVNQVTIQKDTMDLDLNAAFLKYDKDLELKILEAMVYVATQFGVNRLNVLVDHFLLQYMPMKNTVVNQPLTKKIGINNFMSTAEQLNNSSSITIFYRKKIHGMDYLVPQTKRITKQKITMDVLLDEILAEVFVSSLLEQPLHSKEVVFAKPPVVNKEELTLYFQPGLLEEERVINELYLQLLLLSIRANSSVTKVKIMVGEDVVGLGGMNEEFIDVGNILFNFLPTNSE